MSIDFRPAATHELVDLLSGIRAADPTAATRVGDNIQRTLEQLEAHPLSGARIRVTNPQVRGLRFATVRRYPQFVILYLPTADGIEVLHIVRGRRNLNRVVAHD